MSGKEKMIAVLFGVVLIVLFLLSSTDLIIKDEKAEIYPIAVIVDDISDDSHINFRKGVERAAMDLNADVSFITSYEQHDQEQQIKLMLREQQDGNRALIVEPIDVNSVRVQQDLKNITIPLILVNGEFVEKENMVSVTFDYAAMGRQLGEELIKEQPTGLQVYLYGVEDPDAAGRMFSEGVCGFLGEAGYPVFVRKWPAEAGMAELDHVLDQNSVVIAADMETLEEMAQLFMETAEEFGGLYGCGSTVSILNYLDRGVIRGLCVTDDFSAGYLSVKRAVELVEGQPASESGYLPGCYIRREDLRSEKYEKMLYPIE